MAIASLPDTSAGMQVAYRVEYKRGTGHRALTRLSNSNVCMHSHAFAEVSAKYGCQYARKTYACGYGVLALSAEKRTRFTMPLPDARRLLESVVHLVEKTDMRSVEAALLNTLHELVTAQRIAFYELRDMPEPTGKVAVTLTVSAEAETALPLADEPDFSACLAQQKVIVGNCGALLRIIHPVIGARGVRGFLVLYCTENNTHDQELVSILLVFYKNYISLLDDSQRDKLTGLLNRKTFDDRVLELIADQRDQAVNNRGVCLALLDIDHFKAVNDKFGHLYGDEVLLLFARCMVEAFRGADLLFRVGGEEFVVLLKDVDINAAQVVLERFRAIIEAYSFPQIGRLTASIGASFILGTDLPAVTMGSCRPRALSRQEQRTQSIAVSRGTRGGGKDSGRHQRRRRRVVLGSMARRN